ncbi:MAG: hypothetical protein Q4B29_00860 [Candidatus Saccharibacteria bacterium]|nr:hypothetical protein [Candidatus Saccharibacteria bacterium]
MKKRSISFYCSILFLFCQVFGVGVGVFAVSEDEMVVEDGGVSAEKLFSVQENCETIREGLKRVQREDSIVRTHIGPYYNTILEKFVKPLNLRLVENNMFDGQLFEVQGAFATAFETFRNDYSDYQRGLEELILVDCKEDPAGFYEKLEDVRAGREIVNLDALKMRGLVSSQKGLVGELRSKL